MSGTERIGISQKPYPVLTKVKEKKIRDVITKQAYCLHVTVRVP